MPVIAAGSLVFSALDGRQSADPLAGLTPSIRETTSVRIVTIPAGGPRSAHRHPHSIEVAYVAAGRGIAWEDGTVTPVGAGDLLVIAQGVPHATLATGTEDLQLVCFFPHADLTSNLEELAGRIEI